MTTSTRSSTPEHRSATTATTATTATFWIGMAVGGAVTLYGVVNLVHDQPDGLRSIATWFAGGALALDLLIVPIAAAVGWGLKRVLPEAAWPPVRAALLATAVLVAFALPLVTHQGGKPDNPSLRPRDYGAGLLGIVLVVWAVAIATAALRWWRRRSDRPSERSTVAAPE